MHTALLVSHDVGWPLSLARAWVAAGDAVTVVLLDTAAASVREGHADAAAVRDAVDTGVAVVVEARAVQLRALTPQQLLGGVKVVDLDEVADLVADGADRAVWL